MKQQLPPQMVQVAPRPPRGAKIGSSLRPVAMTLIAIIGTAVLVWLAAGG